MNYTDPQYPTGSITRIDEKVVFAHEPMGRFQPLPLRFTVDELQERRIETNLDGQFLYNPPKPGFLRTFRANPMPIPVDLYGNKDVSYETQLQYPAANMNRNFNQLQPLIFPDKYLHQIMNWR